MGLDLAAAAALTPAQRARLPLREKQRLKADVEAWLNRDHQQNQLVYYRPVNQDARAVHLTTAREVGIIGGNRSSKSGTMLAEWAVRATGVVPLSLQADYPRSKLVPPPVRARLVVPSLTTAWDQNLKAKCQPFMWNGKIGSESAGRPGDPRYGHWGWVPQRFLIQGDWAQSWSEKHRTLTLTNGSTLQVMSHEQDPQDYAQGAYHLILHDELPPEPIYRESRLRVLDYGGTLLTGGTPPDDRSGAVTAAWFHDEILLPGLAQTDPDVFAVTLWTERNQMLDPADLAWLEKNLSPEQKAARMHGQFLHLEGLIFPTFTVRERTWCVRCQGPTIPVAGACARCGTPGGVPYAHVWHDPAPEALPADWPVVFYMDPHQSRPTACAWFKVDPHDQWWQVAELDAAGSAAEVRSQVEALEASFGWTPVYRKGDPKITIQPNQFAREIDGRPFTIREAFEEVGFAFEDANTNFTVARERILAALAVNPLTRAPKLKIHARCTRTIHQLLHFTWQTSARRENVNVKEKPSEKSSDFPALLRYCANDDPTYRGLERVRNFQVVKVAERGVGRNRRVGW